MTYDIDVKCIISQIIQQIFKKKKTQKELTQLIRSQRKNIELANIL
jgi:hypothetical protein